MMKHDLGSLTYLKVGSAMDLPNPPPPMPLPPAPPPPSGPPPLEEPPEPVN